MNHTQRNIGANYILIKADAEPVHVLCVCGGGGGIQWYQKCFFMVGSDFFSVFLLHSDI